MPHSMMIHHETQNIPVRLTDIKKRVHVVAKKVLRNEDDIITIAVSKKKPAQDILTAIDAGHRHFGENRLQEASEKWVTIKETHKDVILHYIGALQSKKLRKIMTLFDVIHSIDRLSLVEGLLKNRELLGRCPSLFVQVNLAGEMQKEGVHPDEAAELVEKLRAHNFPLMGLMCLPPQREGEHYFRQLVAMGEIMNLTAFSMGMSNDFERAIHHGATHIRIGTAIFGARS